MNLLDINSIQLDDDLLHSNKHQHADYYELLTSSTHWNFAMVLTINKEIATTSHEALLLLLQKQCKELGIWDAEWNEKTPTIDEFLSFFIAQKGFTNIVGKFADKDYFYKKYEETINGIISESSFDCTKNGLPSTLDVIIDKKTILNVIAFDETWHEHHFFIETETNWLLYHWTTNV